MWFARVFCASWAIFASPAIAGAACFDFGTFEVCTESRTNSTPEASDFNTGTGSTVYGGTGSPGRDGAPGTSVSSGSSSGGGGSHTGSRIDDYFDDLCDRFGCN
jgi:hypothetical protein